ncbi:MtrB/PioB family decaheme-associated outer membrane protein [Paraferrimonas haliotis]|uniref:Membrane protein n=1 Tax=Paraferrimonas haliotis TaxID=2013866 RepID=A0AA37WXC8_9GAMM|nr:MtrB/PioB family decaheme-associated outer membrane protein [Paraferrimonas haliotis]GLS84242.1 membrane protein [Paraferrimonas haliotis]
MKFKLNLITLALIAQPGLAMASFDLSQANTEKVKFDKWECKACTVEQGASGDVSIGAGGADFNDVNSMNNFGVEDNYFGRADADVTYTRGAHRATLEANELGTERGDITINAGKQGVANLEVGLRQIATYNDDVRTPYSGNGSDNLTLPDNWVPAGNTGDMSQLSANGVRLKQKRQKAFIGAEYQGESLWSTYVDYSRETKEGLKTTSGAFFNQSMMLAAPVDYTTDSVEAGVRLKGDNWFTAISYNGSRFTNEYSSLTFDNAFLPTFGGQTQGTMALDPDNQAHTVSLMGQYSLNSTHFSGRVNKTQMTQDSDYVTQNYRYDVPVSSLDGKVDLTQANFKVTSRLNRQLRLHAAYDYSDRENKTNTEQYTQISIDNVNGRVVENVQYDIRTQRAKLGADYRIIQGLRAEAGYDYRKDERSNQDREETEEHTGWGKLRYNGFERWDMWVKGSYGERDGSEFLANAYTSSENNPLLRKYYLADRKRTATELRVSHTPIDSLTLDAGFRYAYDDYHNTAIGLTEAEDKFYDINANYQISKGLNTYAFFSGQQINSEQAGSANFGAPTWYGEVEDTIKTYGAGISKTDLMEDKLRLGLDYSYADSNSDTKVTNGIPSNYGDYFAKVHNLNAYAAYQITEKASLRVDYRMEKYQDTDFANAGTSQDTIWNVVTFGDQRHDYTAHMVFLSVNYKL